MKVTVQEKLVSYGNGNGQPGADAQNVVFIHGAGFDHSVWVMPARYFARHNFNVIAPDLPAHGHSQGPHLNSVEEMATWLHELLQVLNLTSCHIVGHSLGSLVGMSYAAQFPHATTSLSLLGTSNPMPVGSALLDAAADNNLAAFAMANTWSHGNSGALGASLVPGMSNYFSGQRWLERMPKDVYHADLSACKQFSLDIKLVQCPSMVIVAQQDKMTAKKNGLKVAQALGSKVVEIPNAGHSMLSEQPNLVLDALAYFIREHSL